MEVIFLLIVAIPILILFLSLVEILVKIYAYIVLLYIEIFLKIAKIIETKINKAL